MPPAGSSRAPTPADIAVFDDVQRAVENLQRRGVVYGDIFSPYHEEGILDITRRSTVRVRFDPLGDGESEFVCPPVFGRYLMTISTDLDQPRRAFALRHGLGHVLAGHVSEVSLLSTTREWMTHEERTADLFALVDLFPFYVIDDLLKGRTSWGAILQGLCRTIRQYTSGWPEERVLDRARLRIALYRTRKS